MKLPTSISDDDFSHLVHRAVRELPDAPAALQRAAMALWPEPTPTLGDVGRSLLRVVAAALTFDSWSQPAVALGMRSVRSPTRHLLFSAQGRDIDLRIAPSADSFRLSGQILGPDETGVVALTLLGGAAAEARQASLDALGEFHIDGLARGSYGLALNVGEVRIELPPLDIGEPA